MFRKIVSSLPFQPELLEQSSFYVHKLKQEVKIRRLGVALLLIGFGLQIFIVAFPSSASVVANRADIIYGATSKEAILDAYRKNQDQLGRNDIQEIYNYYGIGESQITNSYEVTVNDGNANYINTSRAETKWAETFIPISGSVGGGLHEFPLLYWNKAKTANSYPALTGITTYGYRFWILLKGGGNIVYEQSTKRPSLDIKKDLISNHETTEGNEVKYSIKFRNNGTVNADSVKITDGLPNQLTYVAYTSNLDLSLKTTNSQLEWTPIDKNQALGSGSDWYEIILTLRAKNPIEKICTQATIVAANASKSTSSQENSCLTIKKQSCPGTGMPVSKAGIDACLINCPDGSQVLYRESCSMPLTICKDIETIKMDESLKRSFIIHLDKQTGTEVKYVSLYVDNKEVSQSDSEIEPNTYRLDYEFNQPGNFSVRARVVSNNGNNQETEQCNVVENILSAKKQDVTIIKDIKVSNLTQSITDANNTTARPNDELKYTLSVNNSGNLTATNLALSGEYSEDVNDILEYADITDIDDGVLDESNGELSWPAITIKPGQTIYKEFTAKIKNPLPSTPISLSNPLSYDYSVHGEYGRTIIVNLPKSSIKTIEQIIASLPNIGPIIAITINALLVIVVGYFYYRNKLLAKELDNINKEFSSGY